MLTRGPTLFRVLRGPAAAALSLAFIVSGCASESELYGGELVRSSLRRDSAEGVAAADREQAVAGNTDFAFGLYGTLRSESGNLFYSPYSISTALAMTWAGAREETERQMAGALHFTLPQDRLHPAFNAVDLALASRGRDDQGRPTDNFRLNVTNSLWGLTGYSFESAFLDTLAKSYDAGLRLLDFQKDPDGSRLTINAWVASQTQDRIKDLLPEGVIKSDTRLVLTNAVYFKAAWSTPFERDKTTDASFTHLDGSSETVPTMHGVIRGRYAKGEGLQALELSYDEHDMSMVILLPDAGRFAEVEAALADQADKLIDALGTADLNLALPRFGFEYGLSLTDALAAMGMPIAFSDSADFSGMTHKERLLIADVQHKAWVDVNEAGTEAAAATGVVTFPASLPPRFDVNVDRPFIFLIRDRPTGTVLFLGRVLDP